MTKCRECDRCSIYNYDSLPPRFCKTHKTKDMIDVKNRRCQNDNCSIRASYNFKGNKEEKYCKKHKEPGMILVNYNYCIEINCMIAANFNYIFLKKVYIVLIIKKKIW